MDIEEMETVIIDFSSELFLIKGKKIDYSKPKKDDFWIGCFEHVHRLKERSQNAEGNSKRSKREIII